ncbi:type I restriction-modification enzyme R subunit C-terminal domain-containing protein [Pelovirga terrestris]|uniref:type I restriction-modification enzyme R subunit C-terminal domain-containing protein n=1 Tax=Pelovirga terrestris TaxID=2771352 RepID=UPI003B58770A
MGMIDQKDPCVCIREKKPCNQCGGTPCICKKKTKARVKLTDGKDRSFLDFVLAQYVKVGVDELALEKLSPLLKLKYHNSIPDAVADLGMPQEISRIFVDFQQYLYQQAVA